MRYDHLVVGAGSAGAVVAARLSEDAQRRVLLVEAGPDYRATATPPGVAGLDLFAALAEPGVVWPGLRARRAVGGPAEWYPQGRGVGGSSAVNGLLAVPGDADDYDRWEREAGATGWGAAAMAGPLAAAWEALRPSPSTSAGAVTRAVTAAAARAGHPTVVHPAPTGVGPVPLTAAGGRRVSVNDAYLEPARGRSNLEILGEALVDRLLLDGRRVHGVRLADGRELEADEVILSAGALGSPAILLRSGVDRPGVGANLRDHPAIRCTLWRREPATLSGPPATSLLRWSSRPGAPADLQAVPFEVTGLGDRDAAMVVVAVMDTHSTGRLTLDGADPHASPRIELDQLRDERDVAALRAGLRHVAELLRGSELAAIASRVTVGREQVDLADLPDVVDDAAWLAANVSDVVHAAGTCRLGDPTDEMAVVDPSGRVIGLDGVRVADASVMPTLPRANPHLSCVAIGERLAALIRSGR